jgi:uncharacterized protein YeaO (DUF488 family)
MVKLKRAYDPPARGDGSRFLVERLWPRGIKKEDAALDGWLKELAPSADLRKWYSHDVERWDQFRACYLAELQSNHEALEPLLKAARKRTVTLVFATRDAEHSSARLLKEYLDRRVRR